MELWKSVVGYEGFYEVSDLGNVRRIKPGQGARCGALKHQYGSPGYSCVNLCREGIPKIFRVHQLVMVAFVGPSTSQEVNHIDGNKRNPALKNLEYITHTMNMRHAVDKLGWKPKTFQGADHPRATITEKEARYIQGHKSAYGVATTLSREMGISVHVVRHILSGKTWRHMQ